MPRGQARQVAEPRLDDDDDDEEPPGTPGERLAAAAVVANDDDVQALSAPNSAEKCAWGVGISPLKA